MAFRQGQTSLWESIRLHIVRQIVYQVHHLDFEHFWLYILQKSYFLFSALCIGHKSQVSEAIIFSKCGPNCPFPPQGKSVAPPSVTSRGLWRALPFRPVHRLCFVKPSDWSHRQVKRYDQSSDCRCSFSVFPTAIKLEWGFSIVERLLLVIVIHLWRNNKPEPVHVYILINKQRNCKLQSKEVLIRPKLKITIFFFFFTIGSDQIVVKCNI